MKPDRRGKPSKAYRASLRAPTQADYDRLLYAVVEAILDRKKFIYVAFSHLTKFPDDFPKGRVQKAMTKDKTEVRRIHVRRLLEWLNAKGYTQTTTDSLWHAQVEYAMLLAFLNEKEYNDCDDPSGGDDT